MMDNFPVAISTEMSVIFFKDGKRKYRFSFTNISEQRALEIKNHATKIAQEYCRNTKLEITIESNFEFNERNPNKLLGATVYLSGNRTAALRNVAGQIFHFIGKPYHEIISNP